MPSTGYNHTYLQFRRGITYYYRFESQEEKKRTLGPRRRKFWQAEYKLWKSSPGECHDATCVIMTTPADTWLRR
jgi:hypothetical protein